MAKLSGENKKQYLRERFEEQRLFLSKSIKEFVSGDLAEAVRIAITIRVLVHETGSSKSLLGQLTPNYLDLKILDRAPVREETHELPHGTQSVVVMSVPISVKMNAEGVFLNLDLDVAAYQASILGKWWEDTPLFSPGLVALVGRKSFADLQTRKAAHTLTTISTQNTSNCSIPNHYSWGGTKKLSVLSTYHGLWQDKQALSYWTASTRTSLETLRRKLLHALFPEWLPQPPQHARGREHLSALTLDRAAGGREQWREVRCRIRRVLVLS